MTSNLSHTTAMSAERRQPMWPWLLMPFVALTVYFLLKTAKDAHPAIPGHQLEAPLNPSPSSDDSSSH